MAVVLSGPAPRLAPGVTRLRSTDFEQLVQAEQALSIAKAQAQNTVQAAEAVREEARQTGQAQGRAQAREELLDSVAALRSGIAGWVRQTEPRLVDIALRCVQEIVRSTDTTALVRDSVNRALAEMSAAQDVRIQVHESEVASLREEIAELMQRHALRGVIRVESSIGFNPGDCIVESPLGVVDLRVESQLKFVQQTLQPT